MIDLSHRRSQLYSEKAGNTPKRLGGYNISVRTLTQAAESLKTGHVALAEHFAMLAARRSNIPVYAIEHELDEPHLQKIRSDLAVLLENEPDLRRTVWLDRYLPLLVTMTEVGYRYKGTGTDFWPVLGSELGIYADHHFRTAVTAHFEQGHKAFGLARPGNSAWERHFPLIAWPVGNALVPVEIQSLLADALRRAVRAGIAADDAPALVAYLTSLATGHSSRRFENWLRREATAIEIVRRLLLPEAGGWLSQIILNRIAADIRKDPVANRAMREAVQIAANRARRTPDLPSSQLLLRLGEGRPVQALIRGPSLQQQTRSEIISAMQIPNDRLRVRGSDNSISLHSFLAGGELALPSLQNIPFPLRRDDMSEAEQDQDTLLGKLQPRKTSFYLTEDDGRVARAVFPGDTLPVTALIIEVLSGEAGSQEFRYLNASSDPDAVTLRRHGFLLAESTSGFGVFGLPMPGNGRTFASTFPVFASSDVTIHSADAAAASTRYPPESDDTGVISLTSGMYTARIADRGGNDQHIAFQMVEPAESGPATIQMLPSDATLSDLRSGNLEIRLRAPVPLEAVDVRIRLTSVNHREINAETVIDRLPKTLSAHSAPFDPLRKAIAEAASGISGAYLIVEAAGFLPARFPLPPLRRELRYSAAERCWFTDDDNPETFPSLYATPSSPVLSATEADNFSLIVAMAPDPEALPGGLIRSDATIRPGQYDDSQISLPALLREQDSHKGVTGLTEIVRAGLAWKMAEADNILGEWRRQTVAEHLESEVVGLLCGRAWQRIDQAIDRSALTQHGALLRRAEQLGLVSGSDLPEIEHSSDRAFLRARLLSRLADVVPDITHSLENWNDNLAGDLDLAVIDAYEDLQSHQRASGSEKFGDVDMSRPAGLWHKALTEARDMPFLSMFRPYILPASRWEALRRPFYEGLTEDDLVDLLDETHVDASRRSGVRRLGRPELRSLLQLWLSPRLLIESGDWPSNLGKSLSDPHSARAVRYGTLRYRLARHAIPDRSAL